MILIWPHELAANMQTNEVVLFIAYFMSLVLFPFFSMRLLKIRLTVHFTCFICSMSWSTSIFFLQALVKFSLLSIIFHLADPTGKSVGLLHVLRLHFSEVLLHAVDCHWRSVVCFFLGSSSFTFIYVTICCLSCISVFQFDTEFYISGLAPLCDQLVVLSYVKEISDKTVLVFLVEFLHSTSLSVGPETSHTGLIICEKNCYVLIVNSARNFSDLWNSQWRSWWRLMYLPFRSPVWVPLFLAEGREGFL